MTKSELIGTIKILKDNILLMLYYADFSNQDKLPLKNEFIDKYNLKNSDISIILNNKKYFRHQTFQFHMN